MQGAGADVSRVHVMPVTAPVVVQAYFAMNEFVIAGGVAVNATVGAPGVGSGLPGGGGGGPGGGGEASGCCCAGEEPGDGDTAEIAHA